MKLSKINWRVVGSFAVITLVLVGAGIATRAYFSDTEKTTGNTFTAGAINLQIDNTCHYNGKECKLGDGGKYYWTGTQEECSCTWSKKDLAGELFFNFPDVKPGDNGEDTVSLHVENNDAWVCAMATNLQTNDNGCNKPESDIDTTCGAGQGELQDNIFFTAWRDTDCDNILDVAIQGVPEVPAHCGGGSDPQTCASFGDDQVMCQSFSFLGCTWIPYQPAVPAVAGEQVLAENQKAASTLWPIADATTGSGPIKSGADYCLGISWNVPLTTSNIIQTDSVTGDMQFFAVQARHMENFTCANHFKEICDGTDNDFDGVIDDGGVCWTSPTSNNDASWWRNDANGRDGDINSTAVTDWISLGQWTDTLSYNFSPAVPSNKLRFYSSGNWGSNIEIKATVDGISQLVYSGDNIYGSWQEKALSPAGLVSQIDIRGTNAYDSQFQVGVHLGEIQVLRTP